MRLTSFLILSSLLSGCATFAMGRNRCDAPDLPARPNVERHFPNENGQYICDQGVCNVKNQQCITIEDARLTELWINSVLKGCGQ
jgi:hypothetical protein